MALETFENVLQFCGVTSEFWEVNASNNKLIFAYDEGDDTEITIPDGTYSGSGLALTIQNSIDEEFTCNSSVQYSETTRRFTISVETGHTISYTHSGSSLGLLIGFNDDHSGNLITSDIPAGDRVGILYSIYLSVDEEIKKYCGRNLEESSYREIFDVNNEIQYFYLSDYPVNYVRKVMIGKLAVVLVTNSSSFGNIYLAEDKIVLNTESSITEIDFATNTTISSVVSAINSVGDGWSASLIDSTYSNYPSTGFITNFGGECGNRRVEYLYVPGTNVSYSCLKNEGMIYLPTPVTNTIVFVEYSAGYTSIPEDLKLVEKQMVKYLYERFLNDSIGLNSISVEGFSFNFEQSGIPLQILFTLNKYRKPLV